MPDAVDLARFADAIFRHADPDTFVAVRAFADGDRERLPVFTKWVSAGLRNRDAQILIHATTAAKAPESANFCPPLTTFVNGSSYRGPDGERARADRISVANGIVVTLDLDQHPVDGLRRATEVLGQPTVVVATGGEWIDASTGEVQEKLHCHWRLTEPTRSPEEHADLVELRERVAEYAGADPSGVPLPHPFRWAGSVHRKGAPKLARIVELNNDVEIELAEMLDRLRPITGNVTVRRQEREAASADQRGENEDIEAALDLIENPGRHKGDNTYEFWNRVGMCCHAASDGQAFAAFDQWSRSSTKYDPTETASRWEHWERGHGADRLGMGTLVHLAREAEPGWIKPSTRRERERIEAQHLDVNGILRKAGADIEDEGTPAAETPLKAAPSSSVKPKVKGRDNLGSARVDYRGYVALNSVERKEIGREAVKASDFPLHVLPAAVRDAIEAAVDLSQAPKAMAADVAMTALSVAAHGLADVRNRATGNTHPLSLFLITLGVSGERKSTLNKIMLRPVFEREDALRRKYVKDRERYLADMKVWEGEEARIIRNPAMDAEMIRAMHRQHIRQKPVKPRKHTIVHSEPTMEGLKREMRDAQLAGAILTDEGGQFLGSHAMGKERVTATITALSKMWDGGGFKHTRSKEEDSYECHGRRVAMGLMVQPAVAKDFLADDLVTSQGFLPRILLSYPETTVGRRFTRAARDGIDPRLSRFYSKLSALLMRMDAPAAEPEEERSGNLAGHLDAPVAPEADELILPIIDVRDGSEAWGAWAAFANMIEGELIAGDVGAAGKYASIAATAIKIGEQALRIAGCLHLFDGGDADGEISGETMRAAIAIAHHYLDEALRLQGGVVMSAEEQALVRLSEFLSKHIQKRSGDDRMLFTPRVISNGGPAESRSAEKMRDRLAGLVKYGHIQAVAALDKKGAPCDDPVYVDGKACREVYEYRPRDAA